MTRFMTFLSAATLATGAAAQGQIVSDPAMCGMEMIEIHSENEMTLAVDYVAAIEYGCEFEAVPTFSWDSVYTATTVGYCAEPGAIYPKIFTFFAGQDDPGVIRFYESDGDGEATLFYDCDSYQP